jgi:hypothetical protein
MIAAIETYLAVRRAAGFALSTTEYLLRSFAAFATDQKQPHLRTATVIRWASQARSVAQRHARYQAICLLAKYLRVEDPRHESPPPNYFGYRKASCPAHLFVRRDYQPGPCRREAPIEPILPRSWRPSRRLFRQASAEESFDHRINCSPF